MLTRPAIPSLLVAIVAVTVTTGCNDDDKIYFAMVAEMHSQKLQAEAAVKYIKRTYKAQDELYAQAQERYIAAYSLNHGAISAAKVAVVANKSLKPVLQVELSNAGLAAAEFIAFCAQVRPTSTTRGLLTSVSSAVDQFLKSNPSVKVALKERAVALVEREAKWRSWDEISI